MNDRFAFFKRILRDRRLDLGLAGVVLAIVPLISIARGSEHYIPALIVAVFGFAYIALAIGSAKPPLRDNDDVPHGISRPGNGAKAWPPRSMTRIADEMC